MPVSFRGSGVRVTAEEINYRGLRQAAEVVGPPGTHVAGSCESHKCGLIHWRVATGSGVSHNYRGNDWRAGGLAGRRYKSYGFQERAPRPVPLRAAGIRQRRSWKYLSRLRYHRERSVRCGHQDLAVMRLAKGRYGACYRKESLFCPGSLPLSKGHDLL